MASHILGIILSSLLCLELFGKYRGFKVNMTYYCLLHHMTCLILPLPKNFWNIDVLWLYLWKIPTSISGMKFLMPSLIFFLDEYFPPFHSQHSATWIHLHKLQWYFKLHHTHFLYKIICYAGSHEVLDLSNMLIRLMLRKLNIRWMVKFFQAGSSLLFLLRRTGRNRLKWEPENVEEGMFWSIIFEKVLKLHSELNIFKLYL